MKVSELVEHPPALDQLLCLMHHEEKKHLLSVKCHKAIICNCTLKLNGCL